MQGLTLERDPCLNGWPQALKAAPADALAFMLNTSQRELVLCRQALAGRQEPEGNLGMDTCFFPSEGYFFHFPAAEVRFVFHRTYGKLSLFPSCVSLVHSKPVLGGLLEKAVASVLPSLPESTGCWALADLYFG